MLMKTLIQIVIVAMFGIEICSPFFIGYLNQKEKLQKIYSARETKCKSDTEMALIGDSKKMPALDEVDFTENNYSDSKTLIVKE